MIVTTLLCWAGDGGSDTGASFLRLQPGLVILLSGTNPRSVRSPLSSAHGRQQLHLPDAPRPSPADAGAPCLHGPGQPDEARAGRDPSPVEHHRRPELRAVSQDGSQRERREGLLRSTSWPGFSIIHSLASMSSQGRRSVFGKIVPARHSPDGQKHSRNARSSGQRRLHRGRTERAESGEVQQAKAVVGIRRKDRLWGGRRGEFDHRERTGLREGASCGRGHHYEGRFSGRGNRCSRAAGQDGIERHWWIVFYIDPSMLRPARVPLCLCPPEAARKVAKNTAVQSLLSLVWLLL